jgi:hypothetical protein
MVVMRGIGFCGLGYGLDEIFGGEGEREQAYGARGDKNTYKPSFQRWLHGFDYRG